MGSGGGLLFSFGLKTAPEGHNSRETLSVRGSWPGLMRKEGLTVPQEGVAWHEIRWDRLLWWRGSTPYGKCRFKSIAQPREGGVGRPLRRVGTAAAVLRRGSCRVSIAALSVRRASCMSGRTRIV